MPDIGICSWGAQWQDGGANADEASLGRVAAVGLFPAVRSDD